MADDRAKFPRRAPGGSRPMVNEVPNMTVDQGAIDGFRQGVKDFGNRIVDSAGLRGGFTKAPGETGSRAAGRMYGNAVTAVPRMIYGANREAYKGVVAPVLKGARDILGGMVDSVTGTNPHDKVAPPTDSAAAPATTPRASMRSNVVPPGRAAEIQARLNADQQTEVIAGEAAPQRTSFRNPDAAYPNGDGKAGYSSAGIYTDAAGNRRVGYYHEPANGEFQPHAVAFGTQREAMRNMNFADQTAAAGIDSTNMSTRMLPRQIAAKESLADSTAMLARAQAEEAEGKAAYYRGDGRQAAGSMRNPLLPKIYTTEESYGEPNALGELSTRKQSHIVHPDGTVEEMGAFRNRQTMRQREMVMQHLSFVPEMDRALMAQLTLDVHNGDISVEEAMAEAEERDVDAGIVQQIFGNK